MVFAPVTSLYVPPASATMIAVAAQFYTVEVVSPWPVQLVARGVAGNETSLPVRTLPDL